jgi:hypothetical protein
MSEGRIREKAGHPEGFPYERCAAKNAFQSDGKTKTSKTPRAVTACGAPSKGGTGRKTPRDSSLRSE